MKKIYRYGWLLAILLLCSCKKFIEVPAPVNVISSANVFTSDQTAIAVLSGLYSDVGKGIDNAGCFVGTRGLSLMLGLSADELTSYTTGANYVAYYTNILAAQGSGNEYWSPLYNFVFRCNAAIEGLNEPAADALTPAVRKQLLGEAKFMRAFFYFYLVNLYGDLPMAMTTDYKVNMLLSRVPQAKVYEQIISDLKEARDLLADNYPDESLLKTSNERVRPTQWAAQALLARAYLYTRDNANAEQEATAVINNSFLFSLPALNEVFLKNSKEAIWQVQPTTSFFNTEDARTFIIRASGPTTDSRNPVFLSSQLLASFETNDQRKDLGNWIGAVNVAGTIYHYSYKYKINLGNLNITGAAAMTEYQMMLRLGEQYLIRAEARAQLNNIAGAREDLLAIRRRAGLADGTLTANDKNTLLSAILHERQVELFTELGQRWFDLKRTGTIDAVMSVVTPIKSKGLVAWKSYQQLFPLPQSDLNKAKNLLQNQGY
ncbi:RagB/SusD family nutrient uptake outer membrane protein [Pedobacter africanus]|uniref:RagB/SusD domain-containing protein n=1 Tax=Pedobacter africanus TaxID=151894 RepID=A0A1W1Z725_9SPHI|nr:RagB/SusD family nutrient uptake outer membrane protein [Pedobacter africanus]SMC44184.1 RagB/SusD domain-containing protein [Pedobacter africanus]